MNELTEMTAPVEEPKPSYKDEIDALRRLKVRHTLKPARPESPRVSTLFLSARPRRIALYMGPLGRRANLRALARKLGFPHLSVAPRFEVRDVMGQSLRTLSPFGLAGWDFKPFPVAIDGRLMLEEELGFAVGKRKAVWLAPAELHDFIEKLGFGLIFGDFADIEGAGRAVTPESPSLSDPS